MPTRPDSVPIHRLLADDGELPYDLTPVQFRMLRLAAMGMSSMQIARVTGTVHQTVQGRLSRVYRKLGARDRAHACVLAVKYGVLDLGEIHDDSVDITDETWPLTPANAPLVKALFNARYVRAPVGGLGQDEVIGLRINTADRTEVRVRFGETLAVLPGGHFEVRRGLARPPVRAAS